ncbi:MAG: hypothetical protein IT360_12810 [Gemmatimonadaceae bacterium]|nr:hypothetical protein [Gemmatimonadaceae bacterium]
MTSLDDRPTTAPSLIPALLLGGALPALVMASALEFLPLSGVSLEVLAVVLLAAMFAGAYRARHVLLAPAYVIRIPLLMALSVLVAATFPLLEGTQPRNYAVFGSVAPTLMGWALFLWMLGTREVDAGRDWLAWEPPRWALPALLVAAMATIATVHWLAVGTRAMVSDEVIYLLQGKWIFQRDYAWHLDPDLLPFFSMRKLGVTPSGGLYGQYTPGWPALLALFDLIGLRWWSGAILGTASVWATVRLGTLLYSRAAGLIAGALLLIQPTFLLLHAGYMAHPATILSLALAAVWLIESESRAGWERTWRWLAVGVAIAVAVTVRTLTGVALGASLGLWLVVRQRMPVGTLVRCAATVIVGALPIAAWFLHYNWATNGEALRVSYQAMHGTGFNLGFGTRGFTGFNEQMQRVPVPVTFTPRDAVSHLLQRLASINLNVLPYALLLPATVLFAAHRHRVRWLVLAVFSILPALYFFYWGSEIRFYSEYLPFLLPWLAAGSLTVMRERPRLGGAILAAAVAGSAVLMVPTRWTSIPLDEPWVRSAYTGSPSRFAAFATLEQMQRDEGKLLVFVQEQGPLLDVLLDRLYLFNIEGLSSPILAVRDMGERNAALMARFPDRIPLLVRDNGRLKPVTINRLPSAR